MARIIPTIGSVWVTEHGWHLRVVNYDQPSGHVAMQIEGDTQWSAWPLEAFDPGGALRPMNELARQYHRALPGAASARFDLDEALTKFCQQRGIEGYDVSFAEPGAIRVHLCGGSTEDSLAAQTMLSYQLPLSVMAVVTVSERETSREVERADVSPIVHVGMRVRLAAKGPGTVESVRHEGAWSSTVLFDDGQRQPMQLTRDGRIHNRAAWSVAHAERPKVRVGGDEPIVSPPSPRCGQRWRDGRHEYALLDEQPCAFDREFLCRRDDGLRVVVEDHEMRSWAFVSGPTEPESERDAIRRVVEIEAAYVPASMTAGQWLAALVNTTERTGTAMSAHEAPGSFCVYERGTAMGVRTFARWKRGDAGAWQNARRYGDVE